MGLVLNYFRRNAAPADWETQDLAELYRVEAAFIQAGLRIETDRGVSDEGEPWFVFCHADTGDVIVHFARIGARYLAASPVFGAPVYGADFCDLVRQFLANQPVLLPSLEDLRRKNILIHPSALLSIFVATLFYLNLYGEARTEDGGDAEAAHVADDAAGDGQFPWWYGDPKGRETGDKAAIVAVIAIALEMEIAHTGRDSVLSALANKFALFSEADAKEDPTFHNQPVSTLADELAPIDLGGHEARAALEGSPLVFEGQAQVAAGEPVNAAALHGLAFHVELGVEIDAKARVDSAEAAGQAVVAGSEVASLTAQDLLGAAALTVEAHQSVMKHYASTSSVANPESGSSAASAGAGATGSQHGADADDFSSAFSWLRSNLEAYFVERAIELTPAAGESGPAGGGSGSLSPPTSTVTLTDGIGGTTASNPVAPGLDVPSAAPTPAASVPPVTAAVNPTGDPRDVAASAVAGPANVETPFDNKAEQAFYAFLQSSDDIEFFVSSKSVVFFDQSDVESFPLNLGVHTWYFPDDSTISIVGSSILIEQIIHAYA